MRPAHFTPVVVSKGVKHCSKAGQKMPDKRELEVYMLSQMGRNYDLILKQ